MGRTSQAAALHRQAVAASLVAAAALESSALARADEREQRALAARLTDAAAALVPGWLGAPLDELPPAYPIGGTPVPPRFVRVGTACPLDDARFPAVIPLLGTGHLSIDSDGRDARVAGLLRAVLLRLLAAAPPGSLLVRAMDATGTVFAPFRPLADAGLLAPPATDSDGFATLLAEAQQWARPARTAAARRHDRNLLLVVAVLPESTGPAELAQLGALAQHGPEGGLHLIVAGWPPAPSAPGTTAPPLPRATTIALRERYALLGDPPGTSFGIPLPYLPRTGLNSPVIIDGDPPGHLLDRLCREFTGRSAAGGVPALVDLLPVVDPPAPGPPTGPPAHGPTADAPAPGPPTGGPQRAPQSAGSGAGLVTAIGYDRGAPVTLGFSDLTPHWLVCGRRRAGKTSFLVTVLLGLGARHGPDELELWLVSLAEGGSFRRFLPAYPDGRRPLPQLRVLQDGCGPQQALAVLRDLDAERDRRLALARATGVRRLAELPAQRRPPRLLCVVDEFQQLSGVDAQAREEAFDLLERLGQSGRTLGVHLLLASRPSLDATRPDHRRDIVYGQFPVRVALPGGDQVLRPDNHAAAGLPLGSAVVNTAGGLGGPRGATRGHERLVRFPDPYADPVALVAAWDRIHRSCAARASRPEPAPSRSPAPVGAAEVPGESLPARQFHPSAHRLDHSARQVDSSARQVDPPEAAPAIARRAGEA